MNTSISSAIHLFLTQKNIAVVGDTWDSADAASHVAPKLKSIGYSVFCVGEKHQNNIPLFSALSSIPEKVDAVLVTGNEQLSARIVSECADLGIGIVWLHSALGTSPKKWMEKAEYAISSVGEEAVQLAAQKEVTVIPGGCPMMFCRNADLPHRIIRFLLNWLGCFEHREKKL